MKSKDVLSRQGAASSKAKTRVGERGKQHRELNGGPLGLNHSVIQ